MNKELIDDRILPLTEEEKKTLKKSFTMVKGLLVLGVILEIGMMVYIFTDIDNLIFNLVAFAIISPVFFVCLLKFSAFIDMMSGKKIVRVCVVEDKKLKRNRKTTHYYLVISDKWHSVRRELWDKVEEGQKVEISMLFHSKTIFDLKHVN